jgi:hypothetical protein
MKTIPWDIGEGPPQCGRPKHPQEGLLEQQGPDDSHIALLRVALAAMKPASISAIQVSFSEAALLP